MAAVAIGDFGLGLGLSYFVGVFGLRSWVLIGLGFRSWGSVGFGIQGLLGLLRSKLQNNAGRLLEGAPGPQRLQSLGFNRFIFF